MLELIDELRANHRPVIVDTAGFRNRTTIAALVAADLAIIPLKPAAEDLDCAIATYDLIGEINETDGARRAPDPPRYGPHHDHARHRDCTPRPEPA